MLATFVIGLREGLEAALIVGIVAAFLRREGRADAVRQVWIGVAIAVAICVAGAVALQVFASSLPEAQQEALETIVAVLAVAMVTYMIVWMRRHARQMKGHLEGAAASALAEGTAWALVAMAFFAVLREGFETAVFILAAINASGEAALAFLGAALGILAACALGYGLYRGAVRIDLARFFRLTGLVLVLVAAGLVSNALHSASEVGWITVGQQTAIDLTWLIEPDSLQSALLTNVLGLQPEPTVLEMAGWLLYAVPMTIYVLWPQRRRPAPRPAEVTERAPVTPTA